MSEATRVVMKSWASSLVRGETRRDPVEDDADEVWKSLVIFADQYLELVAEDERLRAALRRLEEWDMLTLTADGHGSATADAPWARKLIADALAP